MTTLYISEYAELAEDQKGRTIQAGKEPAIAEQTVSFSTSTASAAFNEKTKFVRVYSSGNAHLKFGAAPTATTSSTDKVAADTPEYFGVIGGQKVAAIDAV